MGKIAVVYWSGTGNTEAMAKLVAEGIEAAGGEAEIIMARSFKADMVDGYDAYAFGCPAMGAEELEDFEFAPMYDAVEPLLKGRRVGLFGSYDWADGEWMRLWEARAREAGLDVIDAVIAKDYPDEEAAELCRGLGEALT